MINKEHWIVTFLINYNRLESYEQLELELWIFLTINFMVQINDNIWEMSYLIAYDNISSRLKNIENSMKVKNVDILIQYKTKKSFSIRSLIKLNKLVRKWKSRHITLKRICKKNIHRYKINYNSEIIPYDLVEYLS